ncbi:uncharacterized protein LOC131011181 [Salvia miltiorrhiza]|uniref:uncharacterized protein LOC131011181 n=1 Tax=Salvia miltiorrhiza TaxID=226208 RepID=UPI0025AC259F|nr:uncharacterized protein LOC131011181 [Salvia miltiorrhiza]
MVTEFADENSILMDSSEQGNDQPANSEHSRSKGNKNDKSRRSWSAKEEVVLIQALKELVADGWKSDNGFRAGFLAKLEDALKKEFPGTDLRANPHINSKLGTWKKNYYSLSGMLGKSGSGFNLNSNNMIDCDNELWEQICRVDNNASKMRFKSWPLYDDWKIIFGKDRATGDQAEDFMEAINDMVGRDNVFQNVNSDEQAPPVQLEKDLHNEVAEDSTCQSQKSGGVGRTTTRKRKKDDSFDMACELILEIGRNTNDRLEHFGSRIGYEFDLAKARTEVYHTLSAMVGVDKSAKFEVCEILADKVERLELFMSLPVEARPDYLMRVLEMRGK